MRRPVEFHQLDNFAGAQGTVSDPQFVHFAAEAVFTRAAVADPAAEEEHVRNGGGLRGAVLGGDLGARWRRFTLALEAAVDVLLDVNVGIGIWIRREDDGDVMPATIAERSSTQRKSAAVVGAKDADGAFRRVAIPPDMDGMRAELFAADGPGEHGVGVGKVNILWNPDPKRDGMRRGA